MSFYPREDCNTIGLDCYEHFIDIFGVTLESTNYGDKKNTASDTRCSVVLRDSVSAHQDTFNIEWRKRDLKTITPKR